jgi:hypothetical protein
LRLRFGKPRLRFGKLRLRLGALVAATALVLPVSVVVRACFCDHGGEEAAHPAARCTCPMHAGDAPAAAGAHCALHAGAGGPAPEARCELRPGDPIPAGLLAALAALLQPAVLDAPEVPTGPALAGSLPGDEPPPPAGFDPPPPMTPPRLVFRVT